MRLSGITPMLTALRRHLEDGGRVRVLTTTYTNSTEASALEALTDAGADVRVSYDQTTTRLHAKAWIFHRARGSSTAYVGSSNLTHSAMVPGLEWNVRLSSARNPDVIAKMAAVFETYWESGDFEPFDPDEFRDARLDPTIDANSALSPDRADAATRSRSGCWSASKSLARHGHHRNLLVAATGTGKTVMAAVDYRDLRRRCHAPGCSSSLTVERSSNRASLTFRHALHDAAFGELWVAVHRPRDFEHVFASDPEPHGIRRRLHRPDHFDVVVDRRVPPRRRADLPRLLERLQPRELLGLTATPERTDGLAVLDFFDGRIAAELRVWDAIDQQYLVPFAYYGVHDGLDLREVPFRRGTGTTSTALTNVYTADHVWVGQVIEQLRRRVGDPSNMRALGFCVSVDHARFMSDAVQPQQGIAAVAVWGETPDDERDRALRDLARRRRWRSSSPSTCSTKASTCPAVDTHPDAASHRERHAVPPATRPRPPKG